MTSLVLMNMTAAPTSGDEAASIPPMQETNLTPGGEVTITRRRTHGPVRVDGFVAPAGIDYIDQNVGGQAAVLTETFQGPVASGIAPVVPLIFRGSVPNSVILAANQIRGNVGKSNDGGVAARAGVDTAVPDSESVLAAFLNPALRRVLNR